MSYVGRERAYDCNSTFNVTMPGSGGELVIIDFCFGRGGGKTFFFCMNWRGTLNLQVAVGVQVDGVEDIWSYVARTTLKSRSTTDEWGMGCTISQTGNQHNLNKIGKELG